MSTQAMLTESDLALRAKMQDFVASVPRQLLLDMDANKVTYPKEYLQEAGQTRTARPALRPALGRERPALDLGTGRAGGSRRAGDLAGLPVLAGVHRRGGHPRLRHGRAEGALPQADDPRRAGRGRRADRAARRVRFLCGHHARPPRRGYVLPDRPEALRGRRRGRGPDPGLRQGGGHRRSESGHDRLPGRARTRCGGAACLWADGHARGRDGAAGLSRCAGSAWRTSWAGRRESVAARTSSTR